MVLADIADNKGFCSTSQHRSSTGDGYANAVVVTDWGCEGGAGTCCLLVAENVGEAKAGGTSTRTWKLSLPKSGYSIGSYGGSPCLCAPPLGLARTDQTGTDQPCAAPAHSHR